MDPVDATKVIKWAYADGKGLVDYYCNRVWQTQVCHQQDENGKAAREKYQKKLAKNNQEFGHFHKLRSNLINDRKLGRRNIRREGVNKVHLTKSKFKQSTLDRPEDDFYPINRYRKRFGDPRSAKNRALNHKICFVEGHRGVIVPGDDGAMPWKLKHSEGHSTNLVEDLEIGSSEEDGECAEQKFDDLKDIEEANYAATVSQGAMRDLLGEYALDEEEQEDDKNGKKSKPKKIKSKGDGDDNGESAKKKAKMQRGQFQLADDGSDSDEVAPAKIKSKAKAKAKGTSSKIGATTLGNIASTKASEVVAPGARLPGGIADPDLDENGKARGAPLKDCRHIAQSQWATYETADETSNFFNIARSDVQRRYLIRWLSKCVQKVLACNEGSSERVEYEKAQKQLSILETSIKIHRTWATRTDMSKGYQELESQWSLLCHYANAEPSMPIPCTFLWDFFMQVKVPHRGHIHLIVTPYK
jgi:hypothetical protein